MGVSAAQNQTLLAIKQHPLVLLPNLPRSRTNLEVLLNTTLLQVRTWATWTDWTSEGSPGGLAGQSSAQGCSGAHLWAAPSALR